MTLHADQPAPLRIACVGDSITYGARIPHREHYSYPSVLQRLAGDGVVVGNFGVSGTTLLKAGHYPYWSTGAFRDATAFEPDLVIIKLGTNDTKWRNWRYHDDFANDMRSLIRHFRELPTAPTVWVCLPVPLYGAFRYINDRTLSNDIIPIISRVAKEEKAPLIDLYRALDDAPEYFPDGVHPNADGAARIADTVWDAIRETVDARRQ